LRGADLEQLAQDQQETYPPSLPEGFVAEVRTWLSAANPTDQRDLLQVLLVAIREQLDVLDPDL
jgi:hypothetical protein